MLPQDAATEATLSGLMVGPAASSMVRAASLSSAVFPGSARTAQISSQEGPSSSPQVSQRGTCGPRKRALWME